MPGTKIKIVLLVSMAIVVASGSISAAYACYETPHCPPHHPGCIQQTDLKICDQDEAWADGVSGTWMASNMAPGDEFAFDGCFVGLLSQFPRKVDKGSLGITCQYNPWSIARPDNMAKYMEITRCVYEYSCRNERWQVNLLTGKATRISTSGRNSVMTSRDWQIQDVDRDGRITFYDLKKRPLKNLPSFPDDEAGFEMSIRFHQNAGNEFQGDTFTLSMIYTLTAW
jgi:hypothetical protein